MNTIKAVIFDLGRVIIDVKFNPQTLKFFGIDSDTRDAEKILGKAFQNELFRKFNAGRISAKEFYRAFNKQFDLNLDYEAFAQKWCDIFEPVEGMEELFLKVKQKLPVGILSDTDVLHWNYCLKNFPFLRLIEKPTLSFEIGALKPDAICFRKAAQNVGYLPEQCLFIDDRPVNVEGARRTGMQAIVFENAARLKEELKSFGIIV